MAFVSFEQVPHQAPITARADPAASVKAVRVPRPIVRPLPPRVPFSSHLLRAARWLIAIAALALIGDRVAIDLDSPALGIAAAGLAFVFGVALSAVGRPVPQGRYR